MASNQLCDLFVGQRKILRENVGHGVLLPWEPLGVVIDFPAPQLTSTGTPTKAARNSTKAFSVPYQGGTQAAEISSWQFCSEGNTLVFLGGMRPLSRFASAACTKGD